MGFVLSLGFCQSRNPKGHPWGLCYPWGSVRVAMLNIIRGVCCYPWGFVRVSMLNIIRGVCVTLGNLWKCLYSR